jgi:hypothetical protein
MTYLSVGGVSSPPIDLQAVMNEQPEQQVPVIRGKDAFSAEALPPSRADAGQIGFIAGVKAGVLVGIVLVAIGVAAMAHREHSAAQWLLVFAWLPGGALLGGTIGWAAGQLVGPTQKELAGGMAGAVIGLLGGVFYSPLVGRILEPMKDPDLELLRRAAIGATLGLVVGAGLGLFHHVLRPRRRRYGWGAGGRYLTAAEQDLVEEWERRAGI